MSRGQRHRLVKEEEFGPAPAGQDVPPPALVVAATDQPRLARPALSQQGLGRRVVDDAAVAREYPSLRDRHDIAEGGGSILQGALTPEPVHLRTLPRSRGMRQRYHAATVRCGAQASPISRSAFGLSCSGKDLSDRYPSRTPKSSAGRMSMRSSEYISSISTVQRPMPLIVTTRAINASSSIVPATMRGGIRPDSAPSAMALIVAILVAEKPHARRASNSATVMFSAVGKVVAG